MKLASLIATLIFQLHVAKVWCIDIKHENQELIDVFRNEIDRLKISNPEKFKKEENELKKVHPKSRGRPFPQPQTYFTTDVQHTLDERAFAFQYVPGSVVCDLLSSAFNRYYKIIFKPQNYDYSRVSSVMRKIEKGKKRGEESDSSLLKRVVVNVRQPCEDYPSLESDESYTLNITKDSASIDSQTLWGVLRALETFSQLVINEDGGTYSVNETIIKDYPRFQHRGILLDTSRHYIDPEIIKIHLEAMAANKLNVFHWHIVDDESFPYQSLTFPNMSEKGAYDPYFHVYTNDVVKEIIEFARLRGIRVVPEFDSPGHTQSWGKSLPILTPCYSGKKPNGDFGPIDPSNNLTYIFWQLFIKELSTVFPDKYIHLGGDEVDFGCWKSNPDISKFMKEMGFGVDYAKLEQYYEQKLLELVKKVSPNTQYIIWQEVVTHRVKVVPEAVVEIWKEPWSEVMSIVTALGHRTILSACWYLNYISYGSDWKKYYRCDPHDFLGTENQKRLVIGGEACMWGEYVDGSNVIQRIWPRASAVAERLWSDRNVTSIDDASARIEEHRCRMIRRGINAEPFDGSGFCNYEVNIR